MIKSVEVPAAEPGGELLALVAERNELVRLRTRNKIGIVVQTTIDAASSGGAITLIKEWSDIKAASTILLSELDDMFPEPMIALSFSRRILACRSVQSYSCTPFFCNFCNSRASVSPFLMARVEASTTKVSPFRKPIRSRVT